VVVRRVWKRSRRGPAERGAPTARRVVRGDDLFVAELLAAGADRENPERRVSAKHAFRHRERERPRTEARCSLGHRTLDELRTVPDVDLERTIREVPHERLVAAVAGLGVGIQGEPDIDPTVRRKALEVTDRNRYLKRAGNGLRDRH